MIFVQHLESKLNERIGYSCYLHYHYHYPIIQIKPTSYSASPVSNPYDYEVRSIRNTIIESIKYAVGRY